VSELVLRESKALIGTSSALFSADGLYRYVLTRVWDLADPTSLVFVMLNPSTADHDLDDPTVTRCRIRAVNAGFGGLVVLNLFAYRATDPAELLSGHPVGEHNDHYLDVTRFTFPVGGIVFAWGAHGLAEPRGRTLDVAVRAAGYEPLCLGWTKSGHPRHPLYVASSQPLVPFPGYTK
jgi:hypothetical protein